MPPAARKPRFQTFQRPKTRVAKVSSIGKVYVDFKDVESLKKMLSINGTARFFRASAPAPRLPSSA